MSIVYFRFASRIPDSPLRAPILERWLARADGAMRIDDWRTHALSTLAPGLDLPPVVCGARASGPWDVPLEPTAWLWIATPLHFVVGLHGVRIAADGLIDLTEAESEALAHDFNAVFASGGARLLKGRGARLLCALDAAAAPAGEQPPITCDPQQALGLDIGDLLPRGAGGAALRRLMSEMEMWLHDHALNRARRERAAAEIGTLWLWGGARADRPLPRLELWSGGDDALFGAYGPVARYPGAARSGVLTTDASPGEPAFTELERDWLAPALADLFTGRLEAIELSSAHLSHRVRRHAAWRFLRRARPWWEQLAASDAQETHR